MDPTQLPQQGPQLDPVAMASLMGAQPQTPQASVLPPTSPVQGTDPSGMQGYADLAAKQQSQILSSAPAQEEQAARGQSVQLAQQAANMPLPKYGPQIEHGAGFLHNLGQSLLIAAEMTRPGQALNEAIYGPGVREYQQKQAGLAEQIKAAQGQAAGAQEETGTLGQVAGRTIMGGAQVTGKEITAEQMHQRTQEMAQAVSTRYQSEMSRIAAMKDINEKNNATKELVTRMHDDTMQAIQQDKTLTAEQVQEMKDETANALLNTKGAQDPSIKAAIMNMFLGAPTTQSPEGAAPVTRPVEPASNKPASAPPASAAPSHDVFAADGKTLIGHVVNGVYKPLKKGK